MGEFTPDIEDPPPAASREQSQVLSWAYSAPGVMTAVESVRTLPTSRAEFSQARITHVMEGTADVVTADGTLRLVPGMSLAVAGEQWCQIIPHCRLRLWTIYADETLLRIMMAWFMPDKKRILAGFHPHDWDGGPIVLTSGVPTFRQLEPIWRQMSILRDGSYAPEVAAIRTIELFARWVGFVIPDFLLSKGVPATGASARVPITGHLTDTTSVGHVGRAVRLLRENIEDPWTVDTLARRVALSRTHLTRLFVQRTGVAPMRFLTEVRLTEFTRLIEESDMPVACAARAVGWSDPRIASKWFVRRFGITPSRFRAIPHQRH